MDARCPGRSAAMGISLEILEASSAVGMTKELRDWERGAAMDVGTIFRENSGLGDVSVQTEVSGQQIKHYRQAGFLRTL